LLLPLWIERASKGKKEMARSDKEQIVSEVVESLSQAKGIYLTDFSGLNVEELNELRRNFRESKAEFRVVKNTLARLSVTQAGFESLLRYLNGPSAFALGFDDPMIPARIIRDFAKKREKPTVKALVLEGEILDASRAEELANLPPRDELIARLLGTMSVPLARFVGTLRGVLSQFVYALEAVRKQKEE
jgi:large subunit ribosomal protein L10